METFSALLAICAGNLPTQRPVTLSFDVFFDLCLNKRLRKQSRGWWFETLSCPLWRHRNHQLQLVNHNIHHAGSTSSTPGNWLPISHMCPLTNNIMFLIMVTIGMWSPCGRVNPIYTYVLWNILDDRINRCTVGNIHIWLKFFIVW